MSCIWNKNIALFKNRFPSLYELLEQSLPKEIESDEAALNAAFPFYNFFRAKNGALTASVGKDMHSLALHSSYNPQREAQGALQNIEKEILVFAGIGLGYLLVEAARNFKDKSFVVVEQDAPHFFAALACLDFEDVFKIQNLYIVIGASVDQAASLVQNAGGFENAKIFCQKAQVAHSAAYFEAFLARAQQTKQNAQANTNTLEKFSRLWLRNSARNLWQMQHLNGVNKFFGAATDLPAVVFAAGPSLEQALPYLAQIKDRAVTIALDTSVRALLRAGVEPDFIVLTDPQYWASQHIAQLSCPSSILIAEGAVYPSVFRFECREIVLMSSLFPLGKFIESHLGNKGALASGGSVSTTAWDFARAIGSKEIYFAGLDLGYPQKKTHIKGSTFEEAAHTNSRRTNTSESALCKILFSAKNKTGTNYSGQPIITDERMQLFAAWFETQISRNQESDAKTFTFSKDGLEIKGIEYSPLQEFLESPKIAEQKARFFERAAAKNSAYDKAHFENVIADLKNKFSNLKALSNRGVAACNDILCGSTRTRELFLELEKIDEKILGSDAKNVAALVFPTQRQLDAIMQNTPLPPDSLKANATKSRIIYTELLRAVNLYLKFF